MTYKKMRPEFEFKRDLSTTIGMKHYIARYDTGSIECVKCGKPAKFIHESEWNKEYECTDCGHVFYKS